MVCCRSDKSACAQAVPQPHQRAEKSETKAASTTRHQHLATRGRTVEETHRNQTEVSSTFAQNKSSTAGNPSQHMVCYRDANLKVKYQKWFSSRFFMFLWEERRKSSG
jgi:hypothetical protein